MPENRNLPVRRPEGQAPGGAGGSEAFADVRFALRGLRRRPGFAAVVALTLALGIGANVTMFSIVNSILLRPLPYEDPGRLVSIWPEKTLTAGAFVQFRERLGSLEMLAAYSDPVGFTVSGGGDPERLEGAHVTIGIFGLLGVQPALGRGFAVGEDRPGAEPPVVLSHALWEQRFGGDPSVIGRNLRVDGVTRTVVGVAPPGFRFPSDGVRLWIPAGMDDSDVHEFWGGGPPLHIVGRLRGGIGLPQASSEVRSVAPLVAEAAPWPLPAEWVEGAGAAPLRNVIIGDAGRPLFLLLGAAVLVMLLACVNVANLLLARGTTRRRELATRAALGASQRRIARQLLTENLVLYGLGGVLGLLFAIVWVAGLPALLPSDIPRLGEIRINAGVLGFASLVVLLTGLSFGLLPALRTSHIDLQSALKDGGRGTGEIGGRRLSGGLAASQIALAVMLLVGAGLLIQSLRGLLRVDAGLRTERIITARVSPPVTDYQESGRIRDFYDQVLEQVGAIPGVEAVGATHRPPLGGQGATLPIMIEGAQVVSGAAAPLAAESRVTPEYRHVAGVPLLGGRDFTAADRADAPAVALVNESAARRFWPGEDAVGKRLRPVWWQEWVTVVGVVGDVADGVPPGEEQIQVYRPFAQGPMAEMHILVRTAERPGTLAGSLRQAVWNVDRQVPVSEVRSMDQVIASSVARPRFTMLLLSAFAGLALVLGAVGVYGVIAQSVSQRTQEIGIRMALGTSPGAVLRLVLGEGMRLGLVGVAVGLGGAVAAAGLLRALLFGVDPIDPTTFGMVSFIMLGVTLLASFLPARRAARLDPQRALRAE